MDEDHSIRIEHLVEDSKVTDPKSQKFVIRTLNRLHKLAGWAGIRGETVNRSLDALSVRLGRALKGSSCGS